MGSTLVLSLIIGAYGIFNVPVLENGEVSVNPAVVPVATVDGRGTGFFIQVDKTKYLVTAAHVCGTSDILISPNGLHKVIVKQSHRDICIASSYQNVNTLPLGNDPKNGDYVDMTGFPGNLTYDYQKGVARVVGVSIFSMPYGFYEGEPVCPKFSVDKLDGTCAIPVTTIQLNILARPGNSGGPVLNAAGEVVGIIIGTDGESGYMTPVSELLNILGGRF